MPFWLNYDIDFDEDGNFILIPILDLTDMEVCLSHLVINYFKDTGLLSENWHEICCRGNTMDTILIIPFVSWLMI